MNPTDDHDIDDQQTATTKEGAEASLAGESTLPTPIKSNMSKVSLSSMQSRERAKSDASPQSISVFSSQVSEGRRLA